MIAHALIYIYIYICQCIYTYRLAYIYANICDDIYNPCNHVWCTIMHPILFDLQSIQLFKIQFRWIYIWMRDGFFNESDDLSQTHKACIGVVVYKHSMIHIQDLRQHVDVCITESSIVIQGIATLVSLFSNSRCLTLWNANALFHFFRIQPCICLPRLTNPRTAAGQQYLLEVQWP